jgi:hypothetical protein
MNERELKLDRLFKAARLAPVEEIGPMPGSLRTRILAHWRSGRSSEHAGHLLVALFRQALMFAAVVMLVSIAWSLSTRVPDNEEAVANYELRADVMP